LAADDFPELLELKEMQRRRHRNVVVGLIVFGVASVLGGLTIFAFAGEKPAFGTGAVAIVMIGVGILLVGRAIFSALTDYDTKPRDDLMAPPVELDDDDEVDGGGDGSDEQRASEAPE